MIKNHRRCSRRAARMWLLTFLATCHYIGISKRQRQTLFLNRGSSSLKFAIEVAMVKSNFHEWRFHLPGSIVSNENGRQKWGLGGAATAKRLNFIILIILLIKTRELSAQLIMRYRHRIVHAKSDTSSRWSMSLLSRWCFFRNLLHNPGPIWSVSKRKPEIFSHSWKTNVAGDGLNNRVPPGIVFIVLLKKPSCCPAFTNLYTETAPSLQARRHQPASGV